MTSAWIIAVFVFTCVFYTTEALPKPPPVACANLVCRPCSPTFRRVVKHDGCPSCCESDPCKTFKCPLFKLCEVDPATGTPKCMYMLP
ncbi:Hypothetical predicted protein [Paramuricea clavata]|uniref:Uncharacterized protein n=1 Tax=Paramuricea clavata TaxID=317549 RepID=A0A7D9E8F9_PARCT|nr:Hypothetical predicted protein [Paramuricea clavata]